MAGSKRGAIVNRDTLLKSVQQLLRIGLKIREHGHIRIKVFEHGLHSREIGLMCSKGLDPHGENVLCARADANRRVPRSLQGCRIVMFNGCCACFVSKKHTIAAPSTTWAEMATMFDCTIDILGLRNLLG